MKAFTVQVAPMGPRCKCPKHEADRQSRWNVSPYSWLYRSPIRGWYRSSGCRLSCHPGSPPVFPEGRPSLRGIIAVSVFVAVLITAREDLRLSTATYALVPFGLTAMLWRRDRTDRNLAKWREW
jgi:hypothetical protein